MLGPEVSAPILNSLHCCIRSEPSTDGIKKIDGLLTLQPNLTKVTQTKIKIVL